MPSAARFQGAFSYQDLVEAWLDCRRTKRTTAAAQAFELDLEGNLTVLHEALRAGTYRPGRSICFVIHRPKDREVWAASFADRVVHHLLYRHVGPRFERAFIADSCACIPGRGTLYAARRLEVKVRSITQNWTRPAWYLKCDIANFFVAIDKRVLHARLAQKIYEPFWLDLAGRILFHDPRADVEIHGTAAALAKVPAHKSLFTQDADHGLPIGNLPSQLGANIYLDALDQHVKHQLRARHYIRYVDDFILLHESPQQLNAWLADIAVFLPHELGVRWISAEPLLGPVDLTALRPDHTAAIFNGLQGFAIPQLGPREPQLGPRIDWVVVGGESGPGARPMHPEWARSLRDQCARRPRVPFFFKQWGAWAPPIAEGDVPPGAIEGRMYRVGKKAAGRMLDGRTHDEHPA